MTTNNAVNTTLSGQTGTGSFAGSTSPTFLTPSLGAATATSINFGGNTLQNYISETSWTPVFKFGTPGDLSVAYTVQAGLYQRIGNIVTVQFFLNFTPTFTTSSGIVTITGLPITSVSTANTFTVGQIFLGASITYPAGTTSPAIWIAPGTSEITLLAQGSGASNNFTITQFTSGIARSMQGSITYFV